MPPSLACVRRGEQLLAPVTAPAVSVNLVGHTASGDEMVKSRPFADRQAVARPSGDDLLEVVMDADLLADYELIQSASPYREWCAPADLVNRHARVRLLSSDRQPKLLADWLRTAGDVAG